jgi:hypothetical protein
MSKVDALRAMREARYAARMSRAPSAPARPATDDGGALIEAPAAASKAVGRAKPRAKSAAKPVTEPTSPLPFAPEDGPSQLCGHRSINNRSCQRPAGHAEKNHRYK